LKQKESNQSTFLSKLEVSNAPKIDSSRSPENTKKLSIKLHNTAALAQLTERQNKEFEATFQKLQIASNLKEDEEDDKIMLPKDSP